MLHAGRDRVFLPLVQVRFARWEPLDRLTPAFMNMGTTGLMLPDGAVAFEKVRTRCVCVCVCVCVRLYVHVHVLPI